MPETKWVRVLDKDTGHTLSVPEQTVPHGNYEPLKGDHGDEWLPPEYADEKAAAAAAKAAEKRRADERASKASAAEATDEQKGA